MGYCEYEDPRDRIDRIDRLRRLRSETMRKVNFKAWEYADWICEKANTWLCHCGEFVTGCHCTRCYSEAPWGCDCGLQEELREENDPDQWYYDPYDAHIAKMAHEAQEDEHE